MSACCSQRDMGSLGAEIEEMGLVWKLRKFPSKYGWLIQDEEMGIFQFASKTLLAGSSTSFLWKFLSCIIDWRDFELVFDCRATDVFLADEILVAFGRLDFIMTSSNTSSPSLSELLRKSKNTKKWKDATD